MESFNHIGIFGVGLIGGSLGLAIRQKCPGAEITGVDDPGVIEDAVRRGAIDKGVPRSGWKKCAEKSDLIFLCTPISSILSYIDGLAKEVSPGTLVTDVGSTKKRIVEAADQVFPENSFFMGGHPMAGAEGRGLIYADGLLFENMVYILTPSRQLPQEKVRAFGQLLEAIGAKVLFLSPELHDRIASRISYLPQMLAVALVNLVAAHQKDSPHFLRLAAGGFRDMTRIASSPFTVWEGIVDTGKEELLQAIDEYIRALGDIKEKLVKGGLDKDFQNAAKHRLSIPRDTRGFLNPHFDLSVKVEDKPGVIAAISTVLAKENINIKDFEVLKVREGDSGTFRISFESEEAREKAMRLLAEIGYGSRPRE